MNYKKWVYGNVDKPLAKRLAEECEIDPFVALLAVCRGMTDPCVIDETVTGSIYLESPDAIVDMDKAVRCIYDAVENNELIAIYGDYDCDGVVATAILYDYLSSHGANVTYYIPDRFTEGYGMNINAIDKLNEMGVKTVITVDNGINSHKEIEHAKELGMRVVVTDHHLPAGEIPKTAEAVVDCHRADCTAAFKELCGAGVAFKLICALDEASPDEMLDCYGDLAAVATIADVMPLVGENRTIVKYGLNKISNSDNCGLRALCDVSGVSDKALSAGSVSFTVVPRINAAGRMGSANLAVKLLTEKDEQTADKIAKEINALNTERQTIEAEISSEAFKQIEEQNLSNDGVIVVAGNGWHHGVIGIVASRITDKFSKPSVVLSIDGETAVGSARGVETFSLFDCISFASDILIKFGGHKSAAGLTVSTEKIDELRQKLNEYAASYPMYIPSVNIDCVLNPAALSVEMAEAISVFEPFGCNNPTPVFGLCGLKLTRITPVGNGKHLRLLFSKGGAVIQAMLFSVTKENFGFSVDDTVDIAVNMAVNLYNEQKQLSLTVKNMRISGINDDETVRQLILYNSFVCKKSGNFCAIAPTREDITLVYKTACSNGNTDFVINRLINKMAMGKILISFDILTQIGVLKADCNGFLQKVQGVRSELSNSEYYKKLNGGDNV